MKLTAFSLKKICILTLIRNCRYINLTILPCELAIEIMEAVRDPEYGEHKVDIRYLIDAFNHHTTHFQYVITEFLHHNDPQNPILRYHSRESRRYNQYYNLHHSPHQEVDHLKMIEGVLYDKSRDAYIEADYNYTCRKGRTNKIKSCYLEEQLPEKLLKQMEEKKIISPSISVPISSIGPRNIIG